VCLSDYLGQVSATAYTQVQTGAWNIGSASGQDLSQWAGSTQQRDAVAEVEALSARYWELVRRLPDQAQADALSRARRLILEAETSCFLFWGDSWIPLFHARTHEASTALDNVEGAAAARPSAEAVRSDVGGIAK
jgi:hypothetical protein